MVELVPHHAPAIMVYAVVGECVWTPRCELAMVEFYGRAVNRGTLFDWPDGRIVGICPGTGRRVPMDGTTRHLLVAGQMQGTVVRGTALQQLTRM